MGVCVCMVDLVIECVCVYMYVCECVRVLVQLVCYIFDFDLNGRQIGQQALDLEIALGERAKELIGGVAAA